MWFLNIFYSLVFLTNPVILLPVHNRSYPSKCWVDGSLQKALLGRSGCADGNGGVGSSAGRIEKWVDQVVNVKKMSTWKRYLTGY